MILVLAGFGVATAQEEQAEQEEADILEELPEILEFEGVVVRGKNPGEHKGRWLALTEAAVLNPYRGVYIGDVHSDILWPDPEKEKPQDEQELDHTIREYLLTRLTKTGALGEVMPRGAPDPGAEGYLRLDASLLVDPGNRAKRYLMASGKSRSVMEIELRDHATEELVAVYRGYGIGTGLGMKAFGGGARKMTQDDIQENTKAFIKLLNE